MPRLSLKSIEKVEEAFIKRAGAELAEAEAWAKESPADCPWKPCEASWECLRCGDLFRVRPEGSREVPYGPEQKTFIARWAQMPLPYDPAKGKGAW